MCLGVEIGLLFHKVRDDVLADDRPSTRSPSSTARLPSEAFYSRKP